jgi:hypothetical protein
MKKLIAKKWSSKSINNGINQRIYLKEVITITQEDINKNPIFYKNQKAGDTYVVDFSGFIEINNDELKIVKATKEDKKLYNFLIKNDILKNFWEVKKEFEFENSQYSIQLTY